MSDWFWRNWWGEAKASPQLRILNVYSFGVFSQAFIVQPERFVLKKKKSIINPIKQYNAFIRVYGIGF